MNQENCCTDWYEQVLLQDFLPQGREDQRLTLEICLWKLSALWASLQNAPATLICRVFSFLLFLLRGLPESTWGLTSCLWTWRMMATEKKHLFPPIEGPWHNFWLSSSMLISTCGCWLPNCWAWLVSVYKLLISWLQVSLHDEVIPHPLPHCTVGRRVTVWPTLLCVGSCVPLS